MKITTFNLNNCLHHGNDLRESILVKLRRVKDLMFKTRTNDMLKNLFQAVEAMFRAVTYLLILLMGLSIAGLGAYTILFFSIRIGQFLFELIFKERWL